MGKTNTRADQIEHARRMVSVFKEALESPDVTSVTIDGVTTTFGSPDQVRREFRFWEDRLERLEGLRSIYKTVNMSRGAEA